LSRKRTKKTEKWKQTLKKRNKKINIFLNFEEKTYKKQGKNYGNKQSKEEEK